ncbi:MAG: GH32 C-terminal domain-containing protein [Marinilabiliales bacterium]|nr:GH32 C-terminal domain-containing protein [Marinilabiliales bacterium]
MPGEAGNSSATDLIIDVPALNQSELEFDLRVPDGYNESLGIILENNLGEKVIIGYSVQAKQLFIDRTESGSTSFSERFAGVATAPYESGKTLKMHLFIDASSIELFVDEGKLVMTSLFFPSGKYTKLRFFSKEPDSYPEIIKYYKLESIWSNQ